MSERSLDYQWNHASESPASMAQNQIPCTSLTTITAPQGWTFSVVKVVVICAPHKWVADVSTQGYGILICPLPPFDPLGPTPISTGNILLGPMGMRQMLRG
jgi:hypothetical protein